METFILALDQGTTSSRAILFDRQGSVRGIAQQEFRQIFPQSGWVEHDAIEIWQSQSSVMEQVLTKAGINASQVAAIGITNQRETTVVWDRRTGEPVYNAIVWQDRRTASYCDQLRSDGAEAMIREKTGLVLDAYFSATKIRWILDHVEGAREKAEKGELAFGTIDSWLVWNLTSHAKTQTGSKNALNGPVHVTDVTNASRTLLLNLETLQWDPELLDLFGIPMSMLPEVKSSSEIYAEALIGSDTESRTESGAGNGTVSRQASDTQVLIPIAGIAGDQQAALFGQMCTEPGMVKNTYGTGAFMLMNIGEKPIQSQHKLITTVAWKIGNTVHYALEGSVFIAGAVVQWLRDGLEIITDSSEIQELAEQVFDAGGVSFVPAFSGLGAPHWNPNARGTMVGLSRGTTKAHIARAALESMAFQSFDLLRAMEQDSGKPIQQLRVDGGASANDLLMQIQADLIECEVVRPRVTETTALGAAYLAGLAVGYWSGIEQIQELWQIDRVFQPEKPTQQIKKDLAEWHRAVRTAQHWTV